MLNERAPGGPGGVGMWTSATVARMLKNPVYTGQARQGKHVREDAHPAIVPADLFKTVQSLRPQADRRAKETSLLAGLCRCAGCRFAVARTRSRGVDVLRCRRHYALGDCTAPVEATAHLVEPVVVARFFEQLAPGGILARPADEHAEIEALQTALAAAERELSAYVATVSVSELGADLYRQGLEPRQADVEKARDALEAAATTAPGLPDLVDVQEEWETFTIAEKRELLSAGLDAVFVAKDDGRPVADRITLVWKGHQPELVAALPRRGRVTSRSRSRRLPDDHEVRAVAAAQDPQERGLDRGAGLGRHALPWAGRQRTCHVSSGDIVRNINASALRTIFLPQPEQVLGCRGDIELQPSLTGTPCLSARGSRARSPRPPAPCARRPRRCARRIASSTSAVSLSGGIASSSTASGSPFSFAGLVGRFHSLDLLIGDREQLERDRRVVRVGDAASPRSSRAAIRPDLSASYSA